VGNVFIFKAYPGQIIEQEKMLEILNLAKKNNKLIIFYSEVGPGKDFYQEKIIQISKITADCLQAKLSWILGQTRDKNKITRLLNENIQGEFLDF